MKKVKFFLILILFCNLIYGCNTIAGTAKGIVEDVKSVIPVIWLKKLQLFFCYFFYSAVIQFGSVKGVGRDIKAVSVYSRDAFTGNPISDESSK